MKPFNFLIAVITLVTAMLTLMAAYYQYEAAKPRDLPTENQQHEIG